MSFAHLTSKAVFAIVVVYISGGIELLLQDITNCAPRQISHIVSARKSPLLSFLSESINGVTSIRAYGQVDRFVARNVTLLENSTSACLVQKDYDR